MARPDAEALAPFALPLRREADAVIADANGQTVLIVDPSRNLDEDAAERIADLVFARLSAAAPEVGAVDVESGVARTAIVNVVERYVTGWGGQFADNPYDAAPHLARALLAALATREEAPDWTARTEAAWAENNRQEAPAEAGKKSAQQLQDELDQLANEYGDLLTEVEALRAQPPAREDAQPDTDCVSLLADLEAGKPVGREAAATIRSLIAERPASDALRAAGEALEKAVWSLSSFGQLAQDDEGGNTEGLDDEVVVRMTFPDPEFGGEKTLLGELFIRAFRKARATTDELRQALATLQAEQKGGA